MCLTLDVVADLQSKSELGPRPIHWACVNGHIAVVDILLQAGVPIDTVDNKVRIQIQSSGRTE